MQWGYVQGTLSLEHPQFDGDTYFSHFRDKQDRSQLTGLGGTPPSPTLPNRALQGVGLPAEALPRWLVSPLVAILGTLSYR